RCIKRFESVTNTNLEIFPFVHTHLASFHGVKSRGVRCRTFYIQKLYFHALALQPILRSLQGEQLYQEDHVKSKLAFEYSLLQGLASLLYRLANSQLDALKIFLYTVLIFFHIESMN